MEWNAVYKSTSLGRLSCFLTIFQTDFHWLNLTTLSRALWLSILVAFSFCFLFFCLCPFCRFRLRLLLHISANENSFSSLSLAIHFFIPGTACRPLVFITFALVRTHAGKNGKRRGIPNSNSGSCGCESVCWCVWQIRIRRHPGSWAFTPGTSCIFISAAVPSSFFGGEPRKKPPMLRDCCLNIYWCHAHSGPFAPSGVRCQVHLSASWLFWLAQTKNKNESQKPKKKVEKDAGTPSQNWRPERPPCWLSRFTKYLPCSCVRLTFICPNAPGISILVAKIYNTYYI